MELSTPEGAPLQRRIRITVPAAEVELQMQERLRRKSKTARMPGFRPGKVPAHVIERSFGQEALMESFDALINERYGRALQEHQLRPVARPAVDVEQGGRGEDLIFVATVEVYPDFTPNLPELSVERKVAEISDQDVEDTLEVMRRQRVNYAPVERPAQKEDRVRLNFHGTLDGEAFTGGSVDDYPVLLGAGRLLPDMENALEGMSAGEEKDVDVAFPADYPAEQLAGKTAQFHIQVLEVAAPELPELDAEFAASLGVESGVEDLRAEVRENLEREGQRISRMQVKAKVMDALLDCNPVLLPQQLVEQEMERLRSSRSESAPATDDDASVAERRVRLGLILSEIARQQQLRAARSHMEAKLLEMAEQYEDPRQFMGWYRKDEQRMEELESLVLEDAVVDWVLERVKVEEVRVAFKELIGRPAAA